jgi:hypothetical protein
MLLFVFLRVITVTVVVLHVGVQVAECVQPTIFNQSIITIVIP